MKIKVTRTFKGEQYTIGKLFLDDVYICDTLEDHIRAFTAADPKIFGETAIPAGTYKAIKEKNIKFGICLRLYNVPHFEGILVHAGNTAIDTHGCILVGYNTVKGKVLNSKDALKKLCDLIPDKTFIEISVL